MQPALLKIENPVEFQKMTIAAWNIHRTRLAKYLKKVGGTAYFLDEPDKVIYGDIIFDVSMTRKGTDQYRLAKLLGMKKKAIDKLKTDFFDKGKKKLKFDMNKGILTGKIGGQDVRYVKNSLGDKLGSIKDFCEKRKDTTTTKEDNTKETTTNILDEWVDPELTANELWVFKQYLNEKLLDSWTYEEIDVTEEDVSDTVKEKTYTRKWTGPLDHQDYVDWANEAVIELPCPAKGTGKRDNFGHEYLLLETDLIIELYTYLPNKNGAGGKCQVTRFLRAGLKHVSFQEYVLGMGVFSQIQEYDDGNSSFWDFLWDAFKMFISLPGMLIDKVTNLLMNNPITYYLIKPALHAVGKVFGISADTMDRALHGLVKVGVSLAVGYGIGEIMGSTSTLGAMLGESSISITDGILMGVGMAGTFMSGWDDEAKKQWERDNKKNNINEKDMIKRQQYPTNGIKKQRQMGYIMLHPLMMMDYNRQLSYKKRMVQPPRIS